MDFNLDLLGLLVVFIYGLDILLLFYFGIHSYLMVFLYRRNQKYCVSGAEAEYEAIDLDKTPHSKLPMVTVQLPIFNEFYVIDRLIESTVAMEWPKEKLEIQVLDDSTDETVEKTRRLVDFYQTRGFDIKHIHRTNRSGHKAGALKAGLEVARGNFIAIYDADFMPAPDFLRKTIPYFADSSIGMVQTRWGHINEDYSFLTKAQSFGIDGHFMIEQVARNCNNLWMNFNGTGGIWKRECIMDAGNWQSDTLTEDFDLSYRAELAGWKFRYFKDIVNPAELPSTMSSFKAQQFRWCKGSIQTAFKLIPRILRSNFDWKIKAEAITHLINYSVHPLMVINILFALPLLLMDSWSSFSIYDTSIMVLFGAAALLSIGTFGPITFYIYSQRELYPDWKKRIIFLPVLTMMGTGIAVVLTRAWIEAALGIKSSFKRTPKYRIESKADNLADRIKYSVPFDWMVFLELAMAVYCMISIYYSFQKNKVFLVPFMLLYAAGFLYTAFSTLYDSTLKSRVLAMAQNES